MSILILTLVGRIMQASIKALKHFLIWGLSLTYNTYLLFPRVSYVHSLLPPPLLQLVIQPKDGRRERVSHGHREGIRIHGCYERLSVSLSRGCFSTRSFCLRARDVTFFWLLKGFWCCKGDLEFASERAALTCVVLADLGLIVAYGFVVFFFFFFFSKYWASYTMNEFYDCDFAPFSY
jgi:hypothetical protein